MTATRRYGDRRGIAHLKRDSGRTRPGLLLRQLRLLARRFERNLKPLTQNEVSWYVSCRALAGRLAMKIQMPVGYAVDPMLNPMEEGWGRQWRALNHGVLVGCVDNAHARAAMAERSERWNTL